MFYFAYGSNMNHKQMKERCPKAKFIKRGYLEEYRFVYDGYSVNRNGPVANIIKDKNSRVWGGIYEIEESDLKKLDKFEGYPTFYRREKVKVKDDNGNEYEAYVYLREGKEPGKPSKEYRDTVVKGAKDCGLPEDYIKKFLCDEV